ncbi:MAG: hypothetical protein HY280_01545 [Nitrospinae bacterium]|nr:hypothetical protein [Nitrospinota bacterium]
MKLYLCLILSFTFAVSSCNKFEFKNDKNPPIDNKKNPATTDKKKPPTEDKNKTPETTGDKPWEEQGKVWDGKIKGIEGSMRSIKEKTMTMEKDLAAVKTRNDSLYDSITGVSAPAKIDTTGRGDFSVAKNIYGSFLIACDGLSPIPGGYEVKLTIGNVTAARFDGYKLKVKWGDRVVELRKGDSIMPGSWTSISVVLSPATADSVKKILVYLEMTDVVLTKQK